MEKDVIKEICKNLKWYEIIIVRIFANLFVKVYNNTRIRIVNVMLKK